MKKIIAGSVAFGSVVLAAFADVNPQASRTIGVVLHDDATGEVIEFGNTMDHAGKLYGPAAWKSKSGENVDESYRIVSTDSLHPSATLHFVITGAGASKTIDLSIPVWQKRADLYSQAFTAWRAVTDHFRVAAYAGGLTISE